MSPIASSDEMELMTRTVDYRRCIWADGYRLCRTYYIDESGDQASAAPSPDYGYYGAPGIYLGYGGLGAADAPGSPKTAPTSNAKLRSIV